MRLVSRRSVGGTAINAAVRDHMPDIFKDKAFDVEHALVMYAKSFVTMPAFGIYEEEQIKPLL